MGKGKYVVGPIRLYSVLSKPVTDLLTEFFFPLQLCEKCRGAEFRIATRTSTISENAQIPFTTPIFSPELPASVARTSRDARVCPLCPETLFLGNSKRPMCALATRKCRAMHGRSQKGCCLIAMLCIHPCIQNGTLSLRNRASGTVKGFSCFMASSEVFQGCSSLQNPEKCAL